MLSAEFAIITNHQLGRNSDLRRISCYTPKRKAKQEWNVPRDKDTWERSLRESLSGIEEWETNSSCVEKVSTTVMNGVG